MYRALRSAVVLCVIAAALSFVAGCASQPAPSSKETPAAVGSGRPPSSIKEMRAAVRGDITQVMADIKAAEVGASSNPYDYVGISPAFELLIARGQPALDAIASEIETSPDNGLREYLLAIAGSRINGESESQKTWSDGKMWAASYRSMR